MNSQRINKVLENYGICLRRKTDNLTLDRKILFNEKITEIGMKLNLYSEIIHTNVKELKGLKIIREVILLNNPKNIIMACFDNHNKNLL